MATARVPRGDALSDIVIDVSGGANPPGKIIGPNDQIEFTNNAPFPVRIQFLCENGPVFADIPSIATNANSAAQSPQLSNITTDYQVINVSTGLPVGGPYSIEVALNPNTVPAPLSITIQNGNPTDPSLNPAGVPRGGWVQFHYDQSYTLSWNPSSAFAGPHSPVDAANPIYQATTGNQNVNATYSLTSFRNVVGGGGVKIRS